MRSGEFDEYSAAHLERLKYILVDIYSGLGRIADDLYLVGGLVADLLVRNKLVYLKEYLGTLDIDLALKFAVRGRSKFSGFYRKLREIGFEKQKTADGSDVMNHSFIKYEGGYKPVVLDYKEGPDSVRKELIKYKDNADVKEAFKVIPALFGEETSEGVRDVGNILVRRYGLDINFARREVLTPFQKLDLR